MLSTKVAIDVIFIALVVAAVIISAIVVARVLTDTFSVRYDNSGIGPNPAQTEEQNRLTVTDPDIDETGNLSMEFALTDEQVASPADRIYESSPVILPITWGAVAGTLIWRGKVRSAWSRQGYDYDTFRLVTKMRGSPMRIRLLNAVSEDPKNKLQLAKELGVDWKTIDIHIEILQSRLVEELTVVGTARYYAITHDGTKILSLLSADV